MTDVPGAKRVHARVRGRVQGVGYRATTVDVARRLHVRGWVRNLTDGDVELEAEGPVRAIDELVAFLHVGPRGARVDAVVFETVDAAGSQFELPLPFEQRRTV